MTDFVLVHGAWGGSWGFRKLRPLLSAAGHQVFTPSLTGIGERRHLATPEVGLSTHIEDVTNAVYYEDLTDIVLLGFSYGGMVVTGALDRIGDRVRHLVYLDAFVPDDEDSVSRLTGLGPPQQPPADRPGDHGDGRAGDDEGDGDDAWTIAPIPRDLGDPAETAWVNQRRSPQPVATFTESVRLTRPLESWDFTRTYIKATADPNEDPDSAFRRAAARARSSERWAYHEIESNHMVPIMEPQALATILLDLVSPPNSSRPSD